jgi:CheY-like chemotaxis protein
MSHLEGRRVLVVDDDPFMRTTIKAVLRVINRFIVAEADNGDVALGLLAEFKPDVVLCDVAMPRMDGLEFAAQLRKHPDAAMRNTPVIMLTGESQQATVLAAERLRVSGYVIKPVSPKLLGAQLQRILANAPATPPA